VFDRCMWDIIMDWKGREEKRAADREYSKRPEVYERRLKKRMNPDFIEKKKWYDIMWKYGISKEDFESMIEGQQNKCAICGFEFQEDSRFTRPHIDHCHDSGDVRGLLCNSCNKGLGFFKDDKSALSSAIEYLQ